MPSTHLGPPIGGQARLLRRDVAVNAASEAPAETDAPQSVLENLAALLACVSEQPRQEVHPPPEVPSPAPAPDQALRPVTPSLYRA